MATETKTKITDFEKDAVKDYLDTNIRYWRAEREYSIDPAKYYIDAYQSVRMSLFGELLEE